VLADAGRVLAVFVAFAAGSLLSWYSFSAGGPSFFYPAAGVTAAAMMVSRRPLWPWIALAVVAAEVLVDTLFGSPLWVAAAFASANVVEPLIGASLVLALCGGRPDLRIRRDFAAFILGACLIAPVFGAVIGATTSALHDGAPWFSAAVTWWTGDALGVLVMGSPILLWGLQRRILRRRPWETAGVLAVTAALSVATFWSHFPPSILILPMLALAAFRLDMLGAAIAGALAAFLANLMTTRGEGVFSHTDMTPADQVAVTQIYIAVIVVVAMLIAQEASARLRAVQEREVERRERLRLETLSRLAIELSGALTPDDIGKALEKQVLNEAGARAFSLGLVSQDGQRLDWVTVSGYPEAMVEEAGVGVDLDEHTVANDVLRSGAPIAIRDTSAALMIAEGPIVATFHTTGRWWPTRFAAAYPDRMRWWLASGTQSVLTWPLAGGGKPFGVLQLVWSEVQPFNHAQRAYVSAVATMVSQALVRAKVYADERARAAVLHAVAQPVARVEAVGLEYCALYRPDAEDGLGGDWFSVIALPGCRTYLAVGDVIGHGLPAVEDMAELRSTGNAYAHMGLPPGRMLTEMNRFASRQIRGEFATSLVGIFDPDSGTLTYSSAGHLPALLRRADTGEVVRLTGALGSMLGPFEDSVYEQEQVAVRPDDVLVMYTDGLVEHYDGDPRTGIAHLEQVIAMWPPEALLDCEALAQQVAPAPRADDLCLLVVRFEESSAHM
jgi:integral membrane sensor domain MASE1